MYYVIRNNQKFGPYSIDMLVSYVENGQILCRDKALSIVNLSEEQTVEYFLKQNERKVRVRHEGSLFIQIKNLGREVIIPPQTFNIKEFLADKRLLILAVIGLLPAFMSLFAINPFIIFYVIALYFSIIWGLFFFYIFKTNQVTIKATISVFFLTQIFVFLAWDLLGIVRLNPFYNLINLSFPFDVVGYILGVGVTEEFAKILPLVILCKKAKEPLIPQTVVYYGLMSGIAFGVFEGVQYQLGVNSELDYHTSFFMNIARLTSLPFLHAIWCGIAAYFISFAQLYPKYRKSLYLLSLFIPAMIHGLYDVFTWSLPGLAIMLLGVVLLTKYLKQGVNNQSKLSS
ncbi:MAG: PrsW family glutamic-type intramembrane protease [Phocaeicola sp.]